MRGDDIVRAMAIHERRVVTPNTPSSLDALDALSQLAGGKPAVLLDGKTTRVLFDPFAIVTVPAGSDRTRRSIGAAGAADCLDPFARVSAALAPFSGLSRGGRAGAAGFFAYDVGRWLEQLPDRAALDSALPDAWFALFDRGLEIDAAGRGTLRRGTAGRTLEASPDEILERAARLLERDSPRRGSFTTGAAGSVTSNFTKVEYVAAVERVRRADPRRRGVPSELVATLRRAVRR